MHVAMVLHPLDDAGMASGLRTCVCGRAELQRCLCSMFGRLGSPDTDDQERVAQVMRKRCETGTRRVRTWTKVGAANHARCKRGIQGDCFRRQESLLERQSL